VGDLFQVLIVIDFFKRLAQEQEQQAHDDDRDHSSQEKDRGIDKHIHGFPSFP
jgi:hypothetical protein